MLYIMIAPTSLNTPARIERERDDDHMMMCGMKAHFDLISFCSQYQTPSVITVIRLTVREKEAGCKR